MRGQRETGKGTTGEAGKPRMSFPWKLFVVCLVMMSLVVVAGALLMTYLRRDALNRAYDEVSAVADLKANEIASWRHERLEDARVAAESPTVTAQVKEILEDPVGARSRNSMLTWMQSFVDSFDYREVYLLEASGETVLSTPAPDESAGDYARAMAQQVMAEGDAAISDLKRYEDGSGGIYLDVIAPVAGDSASGPAYTGAMLLRVDPYDYLYPLIESWPTASRTSETLLVRGEGDEVIFLNELRHRSGTALTLKAPISDEDLPASMAVRGITGEVEGTDYRGVEVVALIREIPGSAWYIVSKMDQSEAYGVFSWRSRLALILTLLIIVTLGLLFALLWARRHQQYFRLRYELEESLRKTEEKYRTIVDNAIEGIWTVDEKAVVNFVNQRMADMLGYEVEEILGHPVFEFVDEIGREAAEQRIERRHQGAGEIYDFWCLRKDGSRLQVSVNATPLISPGGVYVGALGFFSDITERKQAEEELREVSEYLDSLITYANAPIIVWDPSRRITRFNQAFEFLTGYASDEVVGQDLAMLFPRQSREESLASIDLALSGEYWESVEIPILRKDGEVRIALWNSANINAEDGTTLIATIAQGNDITERKQAEEALRESEDKFRGIVEQSTDGIVLVNGDGNVIEWNSAMENIVGLRREQVMGKALWEVQYLTVLPEYRNRETYGELRDLALSSLDGGNEWFGETSERELQSPDGEKRIVQTASFPIRSREGMMVGNITRDITRRVQVEKELAYELEVNRAVAELSSALLSQVSIDDVSYVVLENAKRLTGSRFGYVGYIDTDTGHMVSPTLSRDIWEQCEVEGRNIIFSEFTGLWGWVLTNREPLLTNAPREDPRSTGVPAGHIPIERFVSVPALLGGALVGQIALANSGRDYTQKDVEVMNRLADLYAMAVLRMWSEGELAEYREHLEELVKERTREIERANRRLREEIAERRRNQEELRATARQLRALSARVESVREEERRHVAREVHDTLGQSLTGLKINLSLLGRKLVGSEEESMIAPMSDLIDATIQSVREISTQLRPGVIDDLGLAAALDWHLKRYEELTGLRCSLTAMAEDDFLDKDLAITLFRIAQEALTNIARHAGATRVEVRLLRERQAVLLEVGDNGKGIGTEEEGAGGSLGILGMRERANIYGGEIEIRRKKSGGTVVAVRIPVEFDGGAEDGQIREVDGG